MLCQGCEEVKPPEQLRKITLTDTNGILLDKVVVCVKCAVDVNVRPNGNALDF